MREIALTSSVLILAVAVLRWLLRGKIAPRLQYALWLLVAVRLLVPGSLFTVPVSVTGAANELSAVLDHSLPDTAPVVQGNQQASQAPSAPETVQQQPLTDQTVSKVRPQVDWPGLIWKAGICVAGGMMVFSNLAFYLQLRGKRRRLVLPAGCETGNLPVYLVEDLPSPCLFGLLNPAIYLNSRALDPAHLPYVLTHERTHFRHGDHLWSVLRGVCLAVHWYNPLVWLAASMSRQDCELACDDGVIWLLGERQRLDYGTALLRMIAPSRPSLLRASTSMTAGKRNMKERILLITCRPRMLKVTAAIVALLMCGVVAVTFGAPAMAEELTAPDSAAVSLPDAPRALTALDSETYTHFSGLFSLTMPDSSGLLYEENEDGVYFYDAAALRESPDGSPLLSVYPQAAAWAAAYDQDKTTLAGFNINGSPYVYLLDWDRTSGDRDRIQELRDAVAGSFQLTAGADVFSRLVHDSFQTNMPLAVAYLPYLSWENYQSMYAEGPLPLLNALTEFVRSNAMDWGQYHDAMSSRADAAITGDCERAYQEFVWELYHQNPEQFGSVLKSEYLTAGERDHMLSWFRSSVAVMQDWPEFVDFSDDLLYELLGVTELHSVG